MRKKQPLCSLAAAKKKASGGPDSRPHRDPARDGGASRPPRTRRMRGAGFRMGGGSAVWSRGRLGVTQQRNGDAGVPFPGPAARGHPARAGDPYAPPHNTGPRAVPSELRPADLRAPKDFRRRALPTFQPLSSNLPTPHHLVPLSGIGRQALRKRGPDSYVARKQEVAREPSAQWGTSRSFPVEGAVVLCREGGWRRGFVGSDLLSIGEFQREIDEEPIREPGICFAERAVAARRGEPC